MNHLTNFKLFENSDYYTQLGFLAIDNLLFDGFMDITDKALEFKESEVNKINNLFIKAVSESDKVVDFKLSTKNRGQLIDIKPNDTVANYDEQIVQVNVNINNDDIILSIYKAEDEWYYVQSLGWKGDLKCDQLEGLYKLFCDVLDDIDNKVNESVDGDLYKAISYEEYRSYFSYTPDQMRSNHFKLSEISDKVLSVIRSMFGKFYINRVDLIQNIIPINLRRNRFSINVLADYIIVKDLSTQEYIKITQTKDEWFYVESCFSYIRDGSKVDIDAYKLSHKFYKCDQLDGLIACLDMIKKKYNL